MAPRILRLATRGSPLALIQVELVAAAIEASSAGRVAVEPFTVETQADRHASVPLHALGGRGVFVTEVERAVLDGRADAAVHSAKDVPSSPGLSALEIAVVLERDDPRDCLVGRALGELPPGARVATGAVRRRAQLAWLRPDLTFEELRGNLGTRLSRVPEGGAVVTAYAALRRLGRGAEAASVFSPTEMVPQVGQGTVVVSCLPGDGEARELLAPAHHPDSARALAAERSFLASVGGGCDLPVGAYAWLPGASSARGGGRLRLEALIASFDGHVVVRAATEGSASEAEALGALLARELLEGRGGAALLGHLGPSAPSAPAEPPGRRVPSTEAGGFVPELLP